MAMTWEFIGGALCLDFLNTVHCYGAEDPRDDLKTPEDLLSWAEAASLLTGPQAAKLRRSVAGDAPGQALLKEAKRLREELRKIFATSARVPRQRPIQTLNSLLRRQTAVPEIESGVLHWHAQSQDGRHIFLPILLSAAEVLTGDSFGQVRECDSPTCTFTFLDTSKNHSRRWCDMRACGNRAKVTQFRKRHRRLAAQ
jgi:predicted RNA-binding Zn ribbon-like protein